MLFFSKDSKKDPDREPLGLHKFDPKFPYELWEKNDFYDESKLYIEEEFERSKWGKLNADGQDFSWQYTTERYEKWKYNKRRRIFCRLMGITPDVKFEKTCMHEAAEMENYSDYDWYKYLNNKYSVWEMYQYLPLSINSEEEVSTEVLEEFYVKNMSVGGYTLKVGVESPFKKTIKNKILFFIAFIFIFNLYLSRVEVTEAFLYLITNKLVYYFPNICDNLFINYFYSDWILKKAQGFVLDTDVAAYIYAPDNDEVRVRAKIRCGMFNEILILGAAKAFWNYNFNALDKYLYCLLVEAIRKDIALLNQFELEIWGRWRGIRHAEGMGIMVRLPGIVDAIELSRHEFTDIDPNMIYLTRWQFNKAPYFLPPRMWIYERVSKNQIWGGKEFFDGLFWKESSVSVNRPMYRKDYYEFKMHHKGSRRLMPWKVHEYPNVIEYIREIPISKRVYDEFNFGILEKFKFKFDLPFILKSNKFYDYLLLVRISIVNEFKKSYYAQLLLKKIGIDFGRLYRDVIKAINKLFDDLVSFWNEFVVQFKIFTRFLTYIFDFRNMIHFPYYFIRFLIKAWNPDLADKIVPPKGAYTKNGVYIFGDKEKFFRDRIKNSPHVIFTNVQFHKIEKSFLPIFSKGTLFSTDYKFPEEEETNLAKWYGRNYNEKKIYADNRIRALARAKRYRENANKTIWSWKPWDPIRSLFVKKPPIVWRKE